MKRFSIVTIFTLFAVASFSQVTGGDYSNMHSLQQLSIDLETRKNLEGVYFEGSPYLEKEYNQGVFFIKAGTPIESMLRINLFKNFFEFEIDKSIRFVSPQSIDSVVCNNKVYVYKSFEFEGKKENRIIEKIYNSGKAGLYSFTQIVFKDAVKAEGYNEPKPPTFIRYDPVIVIEAGENIIPLTNFNKLYKTFPDKADAIKQFIKEKKISKNDISDLKLLTDFLNNTI